MDSRDDLIKACKKALAENQERLIAYRGVGKSFVGLYFGFDLDKNKHLFVGGYDTNDDDWVIYDDYDKEMINDLIDNAVNCYLDYLNCNS